MSEYLAELFRAGSIVQMATLAGLAASVSFGVVGTYVVARRISYMAAAISHSILGGIGAAVFAREELGWLWCTPFLGSMVAAIVSALVIGWVSLRWQEREDTIIGAVWSVGMSLGFLFLYFTPGYRGGLENFLLGSILYIEPADLWLTLGLGAVVAGVSVLFYPKLMAVCFDEEFARLRGVNVPVYFLMLLVLAGLAVVLLVQLAGIVLAIAMIVLPAATGMQAGRKLWHAMAVATGAAMLCVILGIGWSYVGELPPGPAIVLLAAAGYFLMLAGRRVWKSRKQKAGS